MTTDGHSGETAAGGSRETAMPRPSARVVLLDAADRVLLIYSDWDQRALWFTPGGGLDPGETPEDGARRELREETGLDPAALRWDGLVWLRDWTWHSQQRDRWYASHEHFYLVRLAGAGPPLPTGSHEHTDEEILALGEFRWWTVEELRAESAPTSPACLLGVLPALIADGCPPTPIAIGR